MGRSKCRRDEGLILKKIVCEELGKMMVKNLDEEITAEFNRNLIAELIHSNFSNVSPDEIDHIESLIDNPWDAPMMYAMIYRG